MKPNMIGFIEKYGAYGLIVTGTIVFVFACMLIPIARARSRSFTKLKAHTIYGIAAGAAMLIICGVLLVLFFDQTDGIHRVIGNVLTIGAVALGLGVGFRVANTPQQ